MFLKFDDEGNDYDPAVMDGARLQKAIKHKDMDMTGYYVDKFRIADRDFLWKVLIGNVDGVLRDEIIALKKADTLVNKNKKDKDEIFVAKACILELYNADCMITDLRSSKLISESLIDWSKYPVMSINDCQISAIPDYTYDCHTLKGKKMGKTDWDMTVTEQAALYPLAPDYFSEASWIYTYEDDYKRGIENDESMKPIREFAKTHSANPVKHYEY